VQVSIFKDEAKLDINYVPPRLIHREKETSLLREFFSFMLQSPEKMSQRILVAGNVGTGKTALTQRFGADITLEARRRSINLSYVHVNCRQYRGSLFLILHHAVTAFHPNFPIRGFSAEELLRILMQVLDEQNAYLILALDEFESFVEREGTDAIYKLTRLHETRFGKPQRISLICILRNLETIESLDPSTRSTLQSNLIYLEKYSREQLVDIITHRAQLAFKPLTVSEEAINLIAELAYSEGGNARLAIELLWRAGKYVDAEKMGVITPEFVRRAAFSIYSFALKSDLNTLSHHERLLLLGIARFFKENERAYATLKEAEQFYEIVCEEFGVQPYTYTQIWKYVQALSNLGMIRKSVASTGPRGRSTLIYLPGISAKELEGELTALIEKETTV
jgi:cell division control protein 6